MSAGMFSCRGSALVSPAMPRFISQCDSEFVTRYYGAYLKGSKLWIIMEYVARCGLFIKYGSSQPPAMLTFAMNTSSHALNLKSRLMTCPLVFFFVFRSHLSPLIPNAKMSFD